MKKAVVLLSGGLDSTTLLAMALHQKYSVVCLMIDYGQRHKKEIRQAAKIAKSYSCDYTILTFKLPWKGSALLDKGQRVPLNRSLNLDNIPSTYVPARNVIFLSLAASYAEAIRAQTIFIAANARDYSGYPDCRPEFFKAYNRAIAKGMKCGVQGKAVNVKTPLVHKTKAQIIRLGLKLKVPYQLTWSCYKGERRLCGRCDSCRLRQKGFDEVGVQDPLLKT